MGSPLFSALSVLMTIDDSDIDGASADPLDQSRGLCASQIFEDRD